MIEPHALDKQGFRRVLESLVGCDCDNGWRLHDPGYDFPKANKCDRCVLVEVGGVKVRARRETVPVIHEYGWPDRQELVLPAVEVNDE
jgi:hypothetical protein